jgi:hypothetical protein
MSRQTPDDGDEVEQSRESFPATQVVVPSLAGNQGADHRNRVPILNRLVPDGLTAAERDSFIATWEWATRALNAVIRRPNLVLCARSHNRDLWLAGHHSDLHEAAGYVRAVSFHQLTADHIKAADPLRPREIDIGLVTPFNAQNALYDILASSGFRSPANSSLLLADASPLRRARLSHSLLTDITPDYERWGRGQITTNSPLPDVRTQADEHNRVVLSEQHDASELPDGVTQGPEAILNHFESQTHVEFSTGTRTAITDNYS